MNFHTVKRLRVNCCKNSPRNECLCPLKIVRMSITIVELFFDSMFF